MDNEKIGALIREARKERGLTQRELAEALHITDRAVSKWERGLNAPDIALLEPLAERLGLTVGELVRGERAPEEGEPQEETHSLVAYSAAETRRKVRRVQKGYLAALALLLLVAGALLWRSGLLFLVDKKVSPDGESVIRVYNREWTFWPLRFTLQDKVETIGSIGESVGGGDLYIGYGGEDWPVTYGGLWWAPDSRKYVVSLQAPEGTYLELEDLVGNHGIILTAVLNLGWHLEQAGTLPQGAAVELWDGIEYQFLQWGKDSASMLLYYAYEWEGLHEGYFWYNCETNTISGVVELAAGDTP